MTKRSRFAPVRWRRFATTVALVAMSLAACTSGDATQSSATAAVATQPTAAPPAVATPAATPASIQSATAIPPVAGKPPQSSAAQIRPAERREELTRLSALLDYQVVGLQGAPVGKVVEFVINTCETYIVYIQVDPAAEFRLAPPNQLIIPFEAVTINSGILDAENKTIGLQLAPAQVVSAPAFPENLPLIPINWETDVRAYWQDVVRVGKLSSACGVTGGPIYKIAYARQLLGAHLKDANQNLLATVQEAIVEPESGKVLFYVVEVQADGSLVMVPLGKTNIPNAAMEPGSLVELVLLAENAQLSAAPRISGVDDASQIEAQNRARQYWGQ